LRDQRADADLGRVITERSATLLRVGSVADANRATAEIAVLAASLARIGVDGDGLVWITGCRWLSAQAVAALIRDGRAAGLAVLIGAGSPAAIADLAGLAGAVLIHRIADPSLAGNLAGVSCMSAGAGGMAPSSGAAPRPAISAGVLLSLGRGEFVLAVNGPRRRLVELGRLVPARLPRYAVARRERRWRRLRYDPA